MLDTKEVVIKAVYVGYAGCVYEVLAGDAHHGADKDKDKTGMGGIALDECIWVKAEMMGWRIYPCRYGR